MRSGWVLRGDQVLAAADIADGLRERTRGLARRESYDGVLVILNPVPVHSVATRFALDVAFLDGDLTVVDTVRLPPWRLARPRLKCKVALVSPEGSFDRWRLGPGDQLEVHEVDSGPVPRRPIFPAPRPEG